MNPSAAAHPWLQKPRPNDSESVSFRARARLSGSANCSSENSFVPTDCAQKRRHRAPPGRDVGERAARCRCVALYESRGQKGAGAGLRGWDSCGSPSATCAASLRYALLLSLSLSNPFWG